MVRWSVLWAMTPCWTVFGENSWGDTNYALLSEAIETADPDKALTASHTLKGVCGNLSMPELFRLLTCQVEALRAGDWGKAAGLMPGDQSGL